jgi:hypothetical protein
MPRFTVIMNYPSREPFEGRVQAASLEHAMDLAAKMGHTVDREGTLKLFEQDADKPGNAANIVAIVLALGGWAQVAIGLAAIICAVIAVERSRKRRGIPALIFAFLTTVAGMVITYIAASERHR